MKICDLTQFYSPLSGGVKRYVHEKIRYIQDATEGDEHVLIVPGARTEVVTAERSRIYSIHSPLVSRTSRYRALLNLRAIEHVFERERPDLIEVGDPYQTAWKAIASGKSLRIPVIAFYHSHFPEAYLRGTERFLGRTASEMVIDFAMRYVRKLYNCFEATLVPSQQLAEVLQAWGVRNVQAVDLGVNTNIFRADLDDVAETRHSLGVQSAQRLLLYVGRLAPEKNVQTLLAAFEILTEQQPQAFHLLVIGDGTQRGDLEKLRARTTSLTWHPYCSGASELARYYRAADLFVHPGLQETFGFVALESQACGTPVVGIRGSYMDRNILHEQCAWAGENNPGALAAAIAAMGSQDLTALGEIASRRVAQEYSWSRVFEQLFYIYREVVAGYRRT